MFLVAVRNMGVFRFPTKEQRDSFISELKRLELDYSTSETDQDYFEIAKQIVRNRRTLQ